MKKLIKYTLIGSLCLTAVACSDQEAMNVNPNAASNVPSNMVMNGAEKWTMDNIYSPGTTSYGENFLVYYFLFHHH